MSKICDTCGQEQPDNASLCGYCKARFTEDSGTDETYSLEQPSANQTVYSPQPLPPQRTYQQTNPPPSTYHPTYPPQQTYQPTYTPLPQTQYHAAQLPTASSATKTRATKYVIALIAGIVVVVAGIIGCILLLNNNNSDNSSLSSGSSSTSGSSTSDSSSNSAGTDSQSSSSGSFGVNLQSERKAEFLVDVSLDYDSLQYVNENLILAIKDGYFGFISPNGRIVLPIEYQYVGNFSRVSTISQGVVEYLVRVLESDISLPMFGYSDGLLPLCGKDGQWIG